MDETTRLLKPLVDVWQWQQSGACRELPTEMFFHQDGERGPRRRSRENKALAICATCPVIQACRNQALQIQEPYGIWGGLTEDDRIDILTNKLRKQIPRAS
jgi:WhiB family redox-sensing transcriptional regulator